MMKKVFFVLSLLQMFNVKASDSTSFTHIFCGIGAVVSFDKDHLIGQAVDVNNRQNGNEMVTKKSNAACGGQIVLGYGYQFENNLYLAVMHESNFLSKKEHKDTIDQSWISVSRKTWTPSFGISAGYVLNSINFGIRTGISLNRFRYEHDIAQAVVRHVEKTFTATSSYIGVYIEKNVGRFAWYLNVDRLFGKKKLANDTFLTNNSINRTKHKQKSWKATLGIKYLAF